MAGRSFEFHSPSRPQIKPPTGSGAATVSDERIETRNILGPVRGRAYSGIRLTIKPMVTDHGLTVPR